MPKPSKETSAKVRQVSRVLNRVQSYLDAQYFHPRRGSYLDATVLTLLSKSLALARSTVCLVQSGFDEEAFGVSRSLLELAMTLRYITNGRNPEARAKRFVDFVAKIKMDWGRKAIEFFSVPASVVRKDMATYKKFQSMERKFPKLGWQQASKKHAKGIWTMAMEPDRYQKVPVLDKNGKPVLNKRGKPKLRPLNWALNYRVMYFGNPSMCTSRLTVLTITQRFPDGRSLFTHRAAELLVAKPTLAIWLFSTLAPTCTRFSWLVSVASVIHIQTNCPSLSRL
jgi:hypothetical protein